MDFQHLNDVAANIEDKLRSIGGNGRGEQSDQSSFFPPFFLFLLSATLMCIELPRRRPVNCRQAAAKVCAHARASVGPFSSIQTLLD